MPKSHRITTFNTTPNGVATINATFNSNAASDSIAATNATPNGIATTNTTSNPIAASNPITASNATSNPKTTSNTNSTLTPIVHFNHHRQLLSGKLERQIGILSGFGSLRRIPTEN